MKAAVHIAALRKNACNVLLILAKVIPAKASLDTLANPIIVVDVIVNGSLPLVTALSVQ